MWLQEVPLKETLQQELRKHMYACYSSYLKGKVFQINSSKKYNKLSVFKIK